MISPDYTDAAELVCPSEDDDLDSVSDEDEGRTETFLDNQKELNNKIMQTSPWGTQSSGSESSAAPVWSQPSSSPSNPTPTWGQQGSSSWQKPVSSTWGSSWGSTQQTQQQSSGYWDSLRQQNQPQQASTTATWGQSQQNSQQQQYQQIDRSKKVVICNFLDCIVETWDSHLIPGYSPRDIYDLTPRFDVWKKLYAINPDRVYMIIPRNIMTVTNGISEGWQYTLEYFCCCVSSFLRKPFPCCQIIVQNAMGESKADIVKDLVDDPVNPIPRQDVIFLGVYSGYNGQSNEDYITAQECNVDYVDINVLLNSMF